MQSLKANLTSRGPVIFAMQVGMVVFVCWLAVYLVTNLVTSTQRVQRQGERISQEYPKTKEIARALDSKSYQRIAPPDVIQAIEQSPPDPDIERRIAAITMCRQDYSTDDEGNPRRYTDDEIRSCYVSLRATHHIYTTAPYVESNEDL